MQNNEVIKKRKKLIFFFSFDKNIRQIKFIIFFKNTSVYLKSNVLFYSAKVIEYTSPFLYKYKTRYISRTADVL